MMNEILVIGDVHGRTFWKTPVEKYIDKVNKIIFLGDYLDPYKDEEIGIIMFDEMMKNFNEIITLKQNNPNKVVLLLGNHDMHYRNKQFCNNTKSTRYDGAHAKDFYKLFNEDNYNTFKLCHTEKINNKTVIFTHAGITNYWAEKYNININDKNIEQIINNLENTKEGIDKLSTIGQKRSWFGEKTGGPLWCDVREFIADKEENEINENIFQIFGHTRLKKEAKVQMENFACVDSQVGFIINDELQINKAE